jgi:hypothetical protein
MSEERCVCRGRVIPEGMQYCPLCAKKAKEKKQQRGDTNE